jgi:hypothetical protein
MNNILRDKLGIIVNDELLLKALRAVFDERIEKSNPEVIDDNTKLGENYRAYIKSKEVVEEAFNDLNNYKQGNKQTPKTNRGV